MSIFDHVTCESTRMQRISTLHRPWFSQEAGQTGRMRDTIDKSTEYVLKLSLAQNFWANSAQRSSAQQAALRALAAYLYEDVLREIPRLILAIESGDREEALATALRIESATRP